MGHDQQIIRADQLARLLQHGPKDAVFVVKRHIERQHLDHCQHRLALPPQPLLIQP